MPQGPLLFLLILLAVICGYVIARVQFMRKQRVGLSVVGAEAWPQSHYYRGLTHLLDDEPDAAIDAFIDALDVNAETLETHLALGKLLRRRGELVRAVRVHQNLLARPSLSRDQSQAVQLELSIDFLKSGLLDRAETLLKELVDARSIHKHTRRQALERLLEVYQSLGEWLKAIDIADQLTARKFASFADKWRKVQAQFSCELAELAIKKKDWLTARQWVRSASQYDKACVRANILQAKIDIADGADWDAARALLRIPKQDVRFTSEIVTKLEHCYHKIAMQDKLSVLFEELYRESGQRIVLASLVKHLARFGEKEKLYALLSSELPKHPAMEMAAELYQVSSEQNIDLVLPVILKFLSVKPKYQCERCGFQGEQLHWLCPSCKEWSSITAVN